MNKLKNQILGQRASSNLYFLPSQAKIIEINFNFEKCGMPAAEKVTQNH